MRWTVPSSRPTVRRSRPHRPPCEFLPYYEDEEQEETDKRQNKKLWRYRWPDEFRDQVLALLLELNKQRAEQEQKATASKPKAKPSPRRTNKDSSNISQGISFNFAVTDIALGDFA